MVTRTGCGLIIVNIDIFYQCANKVSCEIRIELLLPIYMTSTHTHKSGVLLCKGIAPLPIFGALCDANY